MDVSIQLRLDGHSFSVESPIGQAKAGNKPTTIEVVSAKTILVPRELFDLQSADYLMRLNGMSISENETILHSDSKAPIIALMGVEKSALETVKKGLRGDISWSSPLLYTPTEATPVIWIFRHDELVYLKIWGAEQTLRLAEVLQAPTPEDTLFYITEFVRDMDLNGYPIRAEKSASSDVRLLRKYFKHVSLCE